MILDRTTPVHSGRSARTQSTLYGDTKWLLREGPARIGKLLREGPARIGEKLGRINDATRHVFKTYWPLMVLALVVVLVIALVIVGVVAVIPERRFIVGP